MRADPKLPRSAPGAQQVDAAGLVDLVRALSPYEPHSLMVLRHGHVIAEGWWDPYRADDAVLIYSLSKSFTSMAVGIAVSEGILGLDDRVLDHWPEFADITDPQLTDLRIRHIVSMSAGHDHDVLGQLRGRRGVDLVQILLSTPPAGPPGSRFAYSQPTTFTAAATVQRHTGQTLTEYLRPRLFDPLGIGEARWDTDSQGRELGFSSLHVTTEAIALLGQLVLQQGRWGEQQLVPAEWIQQATQVQTPTIDASTSPDWQQGYGYQFWMARHGFRGDGAFGQFCLVLPENDVVVALTGCTDRMHEELDVVWDQLLPALDRPTTPGSEQELTELLDQVGLEVPGLEGQWDLTPATLESEVPSVTQVHSSADGPVLTIRGSEHTVMSGPDGWQEGRWPNGPRYRARSGRTSTGEGWASLVFADTPHRLILTTVDGHAMLSWNQPPLGGPDLAELRR